MGDFWRTTKNIIKKKQDSSSPERQKREKIERRVSSPQTDAYDDDDHEASPDKNGPRRRRRRRKRGDRTGTRYIYIYIYFPIYIFFPFVHKQSAKHLPFVFETAEERRFTSLCFLSRTSRFKVKRRWFEKRSKVVGVPGGPSSKLTRLSLSLSPHARAVAEIVVSRKL